MSEPTYQLNYFITGPGGLESGAGLMTFLTAFDLAVWLSARTDKEGKTVVITKLKVSHE